MIFISTHPVASWTAEDWSYTAGCLAAIVALAGAAAMQAAATAVVTVACWPSSLRTQCRCWDHSVDGESGFVAWC